MLTAAAAGGGVGVEDWRPLEQNRSGMSGELGINIGGVMNFNHSTQDNAGGNI